jgi:hypothetical protein
MGYVQQKQNAKKKLMSKGQLEKWISSSFLESGVTLLTSCILLMDWTSKIQNPYDNDSNGLKPLLC